MGRFRINIIATNILLAFCLFVGVACFNHPLVGTEELATYLGQSTDEDEDDGELLSILAVAGGSAFLSGGDGLAPTATEITMYSNGRGGGRAGRHCRSECALRRGGQ